jgi:hypothetical protein
MGVASVLLIAVLWLTGTLSLQGDDRSARLPTDPAVPNAFNTREAFSIATVRDVMACQP